MKNIKIDLACLTAATVLTLISFLTLSGSVQKLIPFAGEENEMGFFLLAFSMGFMLFVSSFSKKH